MQILSQTTALPRVWFHLLTRSTLNEIQLSINAVRKTESHLKWESDCYLLYSKDLTQCELSCKPLHLFERER